MGMFDFLKKTREKLEAKQEELNSKNLSRFKGGMIRKNRVYDPEYRKRN
jgi:hypothetical protein